jgi:hypothetical protein
MSRGGSRALALLLLTPVAAASAANEQQCQRCHKQVEVGTEKHWTLSCDMCHSNVESETHEQAMEELKPEEMCSNCHPKARPALKMGPHKEDSCETCHGSVHQKFARADNRACGVCHREELASLKEGIHGQLWSRGLSSPLCADCHSGHNPPPPKLHPLVILRDPQGRSVVETSGPASPARSCDGCHDVSWIGAHGYHGKLGVEGAHPLEPSCFLCHIQGASNLDRLAEIAGGHSEWAESAVLSGTKLIQRQSDRWQWQRALFASDGSVLPRGLVIQPPGNRECAFCHGIFYQGQSPLPSSSLNLTPHAPERYGAQGQTERTGVIFSAQRIRDSGLNISGKEQLDRPWDVHIERRLSCDNCHVAPNHPSYAFAAPQRNARHLLFEPRRQDLGQYLKRPDHRFAPGWVRGHDPGPLHAAAAEMRKCEGCHNTTQQHAFLPRPERHLSALECETCHAPKLYAPAVQEVDWTVPLSPERPVVSYRGLVPAGKPAADTITGFEPVILPRKKPSGETRLAPFNLITTWFWVSDDNGRKRRVSPEELRRALFDGERYHPDVIRALDRNGDSQLTPEELNLDTPARVAAIAARLTMVGAANPRIQGEVEAVAIHHGIGPARVAIRNCDTCHNPRSRVTLTFPLSDLAPPGSQIELVANSEAKLAGKILRDGEGHLSLAPVDDRQGVYVFGNSRSPIIDIIGILSVVGAVLVSLVHGGIRYRASREQRAAASNKDKRSRT